ncbi:uncharacterized protein [Amphiura filiformis]|uniref:uncharacterized protein n=1 Tax=Amphiura filiformis TaxID=82378 RepID=UPI003B221B48
MSNKSTSSSAHRSSKRSSRTSLSKSTEYALLEAATKKAELQCRAEALKLKQSLEKEEFELQSKARYLKQALEKEEFELQTRAKDLQQKRELLAMETEINVEEAKIATLEKYDDESKSRRSRSLSEGLPLILIDDKVSVSRWLEDTKEIQGAKGPNPWESPCDKTTKLEIAKEQVNMISEVHCDVQQPKKQLSTSSPVQIDAPPQNDAGQLLSTEAPVNMGKLSISSPLLISIPPQYDTGQLSAVAAPVDTDRDQSKEIKTPARQFSPDNDMKQQPTNPSVFMNSSMGQAQPINTMVTQSVNKESLQQRDPANSDLGKLTQLLITQQVRAQLPAQKIQVFSGDPLKFTTFMKAFEYGVEDKILDGRDRINYLWQYTAGEPKSLVNSCLYYTDANEGYSKAKQLLTKRFGDSHKIAQAVLKKAKEWPDVKEQASCLNEFSLFLLECHNMMQANSPLKELDNTSSLQLLVGKLPYRLKNLWRAKVYDIQEEKLRTVGFKDLVDFVSRHAQIVANPAFGTISSDTKSNSRNQQYDNKPKPRTSSFVTGTHSEEKPPQQNCLHCDTSTHTLEVCRVVQKKPYDERMATLRKLGVCFGCVKKASHLRPQKSEVEASTTCGLTGAGCMASVLSVVPVTVQSRDTGKEVKTYALLDSKSTAVFCSKNLKSKLAMKGTKTKIKVQTINGDKDVDTYKLSGLEVTDADGKINIELPVVYTQDSIPVKVEDMVSKEDLTPWPYLQDITVPELLKGQRVDLLIGNNVPRALEPLEVIQSQHNGPYACRSALGWEIHGLTKARATSTTTSMASVHRISVEDLHNEFADPYNHDINKRTIEDRPQNSIGDNMVVKSIHFKDGNSQMKLPLSNQEVTVPSNKPMAESRISHLKRKSQREPQLREEYNRVKLIREGSSPSQWQHVDTARNPADECSQGQTVKNSFSNRRWPRGPEYLWQKETEQPSQPCNSDENQLDNDPKYEASVNAIQVEEHKDPIVKLLRHYSKWNSLKRAVAYLLRLRRMLLQKAKKKNNAAAKNDTEETQSRHSLEPTRESHLSADDLQEAEEAIVRYIQQEAFAKEISALKATPDQKIMCKKRQKVGSLDNLDPMILDGILRVGEGLRNAPITDHVKHPMILPKNHHVSHLIIRHTHEHVNHQGKNHVLAELRQRFWIINASAAVRKLVKQCVTCCKYQTRNVVLMADNQAPCKSWTPGCVQEIHPDKNGHVRSTKIKTQTTELCVLLEQDSPLQGPKDMN